MYKLLIVAFLFLSSAATVLAQGQNLSTTNSKAEKLYFKADEYARARNFNRALETLEEATEKDPKFIEAYIKAANLHKMMGNKAASFKNLQKGLSIAPFNPAYANFYFDLADLYMEQGMYEEAKQNFGTFLKASPKNPKLVAWAREQVKVADYAMEAMKNPVPFDPVQMSGSVNKFGLQYFPYTTADQRFFIYTARASARPDHDENIFITERVNGEWQVPVSISENINTNANEGAATISGDGKTLVFTSCSRPDGFGDCDLYISFRTGSEWSKPKNMGMTVNSKAWDSQPSLSADGRTLYFTSTRGGGVGKEDIWVTYLIDDGSWVKPKNMGKSINTTGRDMAPSVHMSGSTLYFVSDGHLGMGGLDVFKANLDAQKQWSEPKNLGYPLNTHADEGSLFITPDNKVGYYSRQVTTDAGVPAVQLFRFDVPTEWRSSENSTYAQGRVFDATTKKPLAAQVQLYDVKADSLLQQVGSDKVSGEYTVVLTEGKQYALYVSAPNYLMNSVSFDYTSPKSLSPVALDVYLEPIKAGAAVVLNNLFFDTGKYDLEKESKTELNKLIKFMQLNGTVKIEIEGHTDDVGADKDNQVLSEKRAKSVAEYITSNGISKDRIRFKGYGETKPVRPNTSEENRKLNRRIEMRVL
ncbi:OmpA family protein [Pontibacter cellulosilyticus]|uniref:OmpA family protein n=1 Tax=Pontibacter cellulosilyticus TaxID=1720253 RepID=A0A923N372_9BACT|nr:OmpA family protein [Pontibacter cellulosilyticus]MBC5991401.1 OmpA family protein [Pontibacter cellulosilyticus]